MNIQPDTANFIAWNLSDWVHALFTLALLGWIFSAVWLTRVYAAALLVPQGRRAPFVILGAWIGFSHLAEVGFFWYVLHFGDMDLTLVRIALIMIPGGELAQIVAYQLTGLLLLRRHRRSLK